MVGTCQWWGRPGVMTPLGWGCNSGMGTPFVRGHHAVETPQGWGIPGVGTRWCGDTPLVGATLTGDALGVGTPWRGGKPPGCGHPVGGTHGAGEPWSGDTLGLPTPFHHPPVAGAPRGVYTHLGWGHPMGWARPLGGDTLGAGTPLVVETLAVGTPLGCGHQWVDDPGRDSPLGGITPALARHSTGYVGACVVG